MIETTIPGFILRQAEPADCALVLTFIKALATYEKLPDQVSATEDTLYDSLFVRKAARVVIGEFEGEPVCFALYFHNFSTFQGLPGLYLEDLYIKENWRGRGFGQVMLAYLAHQAVELRCGRFEWICLDWNENALRFYHKLGATPMDGWTIQRLEGDALRALAESFG
jgi:GNAT superfamily N-acetyltransferase